MKLNCDMGESFGPWSMGNDENVMPYLNMANIACGFHASDPVNMDRTVKLALKHGIEIGAHPGYPDLTGFGRRSMQIKLDEIQKMVIYQAGALEAICKANKTNITYIKPHGALNNDMMRNDDLIEAIMQAVADYNPTLKFMIVATPRWKKYAEIAKSMGIELLYEAFADRLYDDEGQLASRTLSNAVHDDPELITEQARNIADGFVITQSGVKLKIHADSLCIHGDNRASHETAEQIQRILK